MVFVVQESLKHDLTPAREFGSLKVLCPPGDVSADTTPIIRRLQQQLGRFTDKDYILLTGDPVMIGAAVAVASQANSGRCRVLKWSRAAKKYYPVSLDLASIKA